MMVCRRASAVFARHAWNVRRFMPLITTVRAAVPMVPTFFERECVSHQA